LTVGSKQSKEGVYLKKLQQALNYDPEVLENLHNINLASSFDSDVGVKIKNKVNTDSSEVYNSVDTNNEIKDYQEKIKLKNPVKKEEILIKNEFDPEYMKKKIFWKKLNIPEGSSLSLAIQVSRPDILPGIFFQGDGIVLDAVIEVPLWFDLDVYAKHVYEEVKPKPPAAVAAIANAVAAASPPASGGGERASRDSPEDSKIIGYERCYLYDQIETFTARTMEITPSQAHACILRTICELHSLVTFRPEFANASMLFELVIMFLTPSLGIDADCFAPYIQAERSGREKTLCYSYSRECPISLASVILSNFVS
ncbi:unnamed protein product, partial [Allacma fusca]